MRTINLTIFSLIFAVAVAAQTNGDTQAPQTVVLPDAENAPRVAEVVPAADPAELLAPKPSRPFTMPVAERINPTIPQQANYVHPNSEERFKRYLRRSFTTGLIGVGAGTIVGHISEKPPEWDRSAEGFGRRLASNFGENLIKQSVAYGIEEALDLNSKFYKSKKRDVGSRITNAFLSTFTARDRNGKRVINPGPVTGRVVANVISSETWYPDRFSYKDGLRRSARGIGFEIGLNLMREFIFPR